MGIEENGRFEGYQGSRMYRVVHPVHGTVDVAAPSNLAAIIAAAKVWDERWQDDEFFFACKACVLTKSGRWAME